MRKVILPVVFLLIGITAICQNPQLLRDVYPGSTGSGIQQIVKTSNYTFFNAEDEDADTDRGLYRTDGTLGGTIKLNLTYPTYISTKAEKLTALGDKVVFAGDNRQYYGEVWVSDGTQAGTIALESFQPTAGRTAVMDMTRLGTDVLYGVIDNSNHTLLKKTDGTPGGTSVIYDFSAFASPPEIGLSQTINNILYFNIYDIGGSGVDQLWCSDGTTAGTYMLKDFGLDQFVASWYMPASNLFYWMIVVPGTGNVLWKSDGTAAGTEAVKTIGTSGNNNYPPFAAIGSTLYFAGLDGNGKELWKTDGTAAGTVMVADINPGAGNSNPAGLTVLNGNIYFSATNSQGNELWKFDGTTATIVKDIYPGTSSGSVSRLVESNGTIIFSAANDGTGTEPWITDGTAANTKQLADINPVGASSPNLFTPGNPVYFSANNGVNGAELFKYDNNVSITNIHSKIYVNDNSTLNDVYTGAVGDNANAGTKAAPVLTVMYAISIAQPGDTIIVDAGIYPERILASKSLYFKGAFSGVNPGSSLNRGASETILLPSAENNLLEIVTVQATNVTFDGFLFDGDNPAITGSITLNGVDVNAGMAFFNINLQTDNLVIKNNIIKNFLRYGMLLQKTTTALTGVNISQNHIDNISSRTPRDGRAVGLFNNAYATVSNNSLTRVNTGVLIANFNVASADSVLISSNTIEAYSVGVSSSNHTNLTSSITADNNQIAVADLVAWSAPGSSPANNCVGINMGFATSTKNILLSNNTITGTRAGIGASQFTSTGQLLLENNIVTGTQTGMQLSSINTPLPVSVTGGSVSNSSQLGFFYIGNGTATDMLSMNNVSLTNNVVGMDVSAVGGNLQMEFAGVTINGGTTGIRFYGTQLSLPGNILSGVSFTNQTKEYILQTSGSFAGQTIDASTVSFDGIIPTNMTLAQLFATEDKLTHKIDFDGVGYFKLKPTEVFLTANSFAADLPPVFGTPTTTPQINRAVGAAAPGDIINIKAGTYINQVTIDKALTLKGEGRTVTNIVIPASGLIDPPGFSEKGVIQSAQGIGVVNISDLSVTSDASISVHCILLQTGGSVKDCNLSNGNQGVFFRAQTGTSVALIQNNLIQDVIIGVNCQGAGMTASILNNTITNWNGSFSAGIFAGLDFGPLQQLTVTNNLISNYKNYGIFGNSNNSYYYQNSITGISGKSIEQFSGNPITAKCNWFGTIDDISIASGITGAVNYIPWLTDGADNDVALGFQPLPNTCNGYNHKLYVNDNLYTPGIEVFTSAVGSNTNPGTPAAPFATPDYAYSIAQPGDTIYVDAGSYNLGGLTYSFPKPVVFLGTNYLVSPNDPSNKLLLNAARNAESIFTNAKMSIASSGISIEGFTWDVGNRTGVELINTAGTNNDFGNFKFSKNIYRINSNLTQFSITGKFVTSPAMPVTNNYLFEDNRFEKYNTVTGTTFLFNYVSDINITGNSFVTIGAGSKTQTACNLGSTGIVNNFSFNNNAAENTGIIVNCTRLANGVILNNYLKNVDRATNVNSLMPESTNIEFSNNIVEATTGGGGFVGYSRSGTSLPGTSNIFKVENNIFTGIAIPNVALQLFGSMNFTVSNSVLNSSFLIRGNKINYSGDFSLISNDFIRPITVRGNVAELTLDGNEVVLNNTGSSLYPALVTALPPNPAFTINTDFNATSYMPATAIINIRNNKVQGYKQSVVFYDATTSGRDSYQGYGNIPLGATVNVFNNSLTGDSISINSGNIGELVNATCNWYGSNTEQNINSKLSLSTVKHIPWLSNGADNDVATGFQPVPNSCNGYNRKLYVNDNLYTPGVEVFTSAIGSNTNTGTPAAPFATLDYAYSVAEPGDTIYVDAGTFTPGNFTIDKSVTFLGTNYLITPNNPSDKLVYNTSRNAESIISNSTITFAADNINIEGLRFNTPNTTQLTLSSTAVANDLCRNIKLSKNRFVSTTTAFTLFSFIGKAGTLVTGGYIIDDNRMEEGAGAYMRLSNLTDVTITNNSLIRSAVPVQGGLVAIRPQGPITNLVAENNTIQNWDVTLIQGGAPIKNLVYNNNNLISCQRCIQLTSTDAEPSTLTITNNNITQHSTAFAPVISIVRSTALNAVSPNLLTIENNSITKVAAAQTSTLFPLIDLTCNNSSSTGDPLSSNYQVSIKRNKLLYSGDMSTAITANPYGIQLSGKMAISSIENNELTFSGTNLLSPAANSPLRPTGIFFNNSSGIPTGAAINIFNNKVQGFKHSVAFYNGTQYGGLASGISANINNNSFTGDSISINNGEVGEMIDATCNWYGAIAAHNVSSKVTETTVNHSPWLTNGTDTDVATGFQPVANSCNGVPVDADIILVTNVTCNGAANGAIEVEIEEGLAPFTYAWSKDEVPGFSTSEDLDNLAPGFYKLIVTDANGSIDSVFTDISEPDLLTASANGTNNICFGALAGTASASTVGGTAPYTYLWSNGETTEDISNLIAGIYSVTITDANGCTANALYEVTQPTLLTAVATGTSTGCFNSVTVVANGGTGSYTYLWSNGATTSTITSIASGTYSVTVTDVNGCTAVASATVTANEAFNPSASVTDVICNGEENGTITVTNVNAVAPFQYSIDGGLNFQNSNVFNGLAAGTYTITVKDANGCTGFVTKTVTQPPLLVATLVTVQSTCYGLSTGSISVNVAGGTSGYSYAWTGSGYSSTQKNISSLPAGTYNFTVTDSKGCTASLSAIVLSANEITIGATVTNIACKGEVNGSIALNVTGGSGSGFTYQWNNGAVTNSISNLGVANYTVTVTDIGTGCTKSRSFTITQPASLINLSVSKTNATGCASLGTITATGSGGTGTYQYKLNNGTYQSSGLFSGLYAGSYTVWVKDANGCTKSAAVSITDNGSDQYESNNSKNQAKAISVSTTINARIALATDVADWFKFTTASAGNYIVTFTHPSASFVFNMYAAGSNTPALVPVSSTATTKEYTLAGSTTYYISITGGLSYTCYNLVVAPIAFTARNLNGNEQKLTKKVEVITMNAMVYPNPHKGAFTIKIASPEDGIAKIELFTVSGQKIASKTVDVQMSENNLIPFSGITQGTVFYRVQIGKNVVTGKVIGIE